MLTIQPLRDDNREAALGLLHGRKESSLFLLSNLEELGPVLTDHPSSANVKCLRSESGVHAVFALTRRGNLLAQTDRNEDYSVEILRSCREESVALRGFVGDWDVIEPLVARHKSLTPAFSAATFKREVLFRLPLDKAGADEFRAVDAQAKLLSADDFAEWDRLSLSFIAEARLPDSLNEIQRRRSFDRLVEKRCVWGLRFGGRLVSIAAYNARISGMAQVGGVYTVPECRRRGYSRAVMQGLIRDSLRLHALKALVLFTGEDNGSAQSLYRSLKFGEIGRFALVFA